jgi:heat shock protein HtpX
MAADREKARHHWKEHTHNSWIFFLALVVVTLVLAGAGLRLLKPPAVISLLITLTVVQTFFFLNSGRLVIWMMGCKELNKEQQERLQPLFVKLVKRTDLPYTPQLFIATGMDVPNAFAFGTGIMGGSGVALTELIIELLYDDELSAVLAHELGHIRSRDTALMTMISLSLTLINNGTKQLANIGRMAVFFALAIEVASYLPRIVASGITQLREYAADAYSAYLTGEVQPMIRAFRKMEEWHRSHAKDDNPLKMLQRRRMDELLLSHPDMSSRIAMLNQLEES